MIPSAVIPPIDAPATASRFPPPARPAERVTQPGELGQIAVQRLPEQPQPRLLIARKACPMIRRIRHDHPETGLRQLTAK